MRALLVLAAATLACLLAVAATAAPPPVRAEAYLVESATTGEVLARDDERERLPIASITKLMTALVALERTRPDEVAVVSRRSAAVGESTIHLVPGERIAVRDLIRAALIQSANDAATALAEHVGGTIPRFVRLMNERARALGLTDTHFVNPSGLDAPGHVSSARDVTKLARVAMRKPFIRETVRQVTATAAGRTLTTWNDLLSREPSVFGVKTGHTSGAGWSQVAAARRGGITVYATLLGGETREGRNDDLAELLSWALDLYRRAWTIAGDRVYATARTAYGREPVRLVAAAPALRVVRVDRPLVERVVAPVEVALPVRAGQRLGRVEVLDRGEVVASSPLVAAESIRLPDRLDRVGFYAGRTVHHLWGLLT